MHKKTIIIKTLGFKVVDVITLTGHSVICLLLWICYNFQLVSLKIIKSCIFDYFLILPFILIFLLFRNLRNIKFYFFWFIFGLLQLLVYYNAKDNTDFFFARGTGLVSLKILLPVLIMFQILRQISLIVYKQEMILSLRHFRMSFYEEEENRNMTWMEVLFSLILYATAIIFNNG
jgi:hypothetical protein